MASIAAYPDPLRAALPIAETDVILFGLVLCGLAYAGTASQTNLLFTAGLLIIFCAELLRKEGERGMEPMAVTLFGVLFSINAVNLRRIYDL